MTGKDCADSLATRMSQWHAVLVEVIGGMIGPEMMDAEIVQACAVLAVYLGTRGIGRYWESVEEASYQDPSLTRRDMS